MQYLLLIYNNERNWTEASDADLGTLMGDYRSFTESIAKSGHYKGGNALLQRPLEDGGQGREVSRHCAGWPSARYSRN